MKNPLADALLGGGHIPPTRARVGTVSGTSPLEVTLAGQTGLSAARANTYTPVLNDTVLVLQLEPDLIVMCSIISGG